MQTLQIFKAYITSILRKVYYLLYIFSCRSQMSLLFCHLRFSFHLWAGTMWWQWTWQHATLLCAQNPVQKFVLPSRNSERKTPSCTHDTHIQPCLSMFTAKNKGSFSLSWCFLWFTSNNNLFWVMSLDVIRIRLNCWNNTTRNTECKEDL